MSFTLLRPVSGSGTSTNTVITATIGSTDTAAVDSTPCEFTTIKWIVTITDTTAETVHSSEVLAQCRPAGINPAYVAHTRYAKLGDPVDHLLDVVLSGGNVELQITNNEANDIEVRVIRIRV